MNFLNPYKYIIDLVLVVSVIAGFAFGVHKYNSYQQAIGAERVQMEWDRANEVADGARRQREIQLQKEKDNAITQAQKSIQAANAGAAAAADAGRVLHSTIETLIARSDTDSVDANRKYTAAIAAVFQSCTDEYRKLGREAQGHADDSLMYQKAWPK